MKIDDLKSLSADDLWTLRERITTELSRKLVAERTALEIRLRRLTSVTSVNAKRERRPYPKVRAKYRNPRNRQETWAGRGKQPRWLAAQLRSGKKLDDFRIKA